MEMNRRQLMTAFAASVAAGVVPALPATAAAVVLPPASEAHEFIHVRVLDDVYRAQEWTDGETLRQVFKSDWHFDDDTYPGRTLIRHVPTGLTYTYAVLLDDEEEDADAVRQLHPDCCRPRPNAEGDPLGIIGHAAALVSLHVRCVFDDMREQHKGHPIFIHYPWDGLDGNADLEPVMTEAPPIWVYERPEDA